MRLFFDISAFAKRYVKEAGSDRVIKLCAQADAIGLIVICLPELISTLCLLVREGHITETEYELLKADILAEMDDTDVCDLTPAVLKRILDCLERNTLRAMDAIQVASALTYGSDLFVSADQRQIDAARNEGLRVEDMT